MQQDILWLMSHIYPERLRNSDALTARMMVSVPSVPIFFLKVSSMFLSICLPKSIKSNKIHRQFQ